MKLIEPIRQGAALFAHYGYQDASGDFFISIDTKKCNGCGDCVTAPLLGGMLDSGHLTFMVKALDPMSGFFFPNGA